MALDPSLKINWGQWPGLLEAVRAALPRADTVVFVTPHYVEGSDPPRLHPAPGPRPRVLQPADRAPHKPRGLALSRLWLVLDCNNLAYRALFSSGGLSHNGIATGVVFGLLRDISNLGKEYNTNDFAFTFDYGKGLREQKYPWYKGSRRKRKLSEEEEQNRQEMRDQLDRLRTEYLTRIGYGNIFAQRGYEADDLMAAVAAGLDDGDRAIMVTSDQDAWQLLGRQVAVLDPRTKELMTARRFKREKGIHPSYWTEVKALAGCSSDDIPGAKQVGEKTAIKYLLGELKDGPQLRNIKEWKASPNYRENQELIELPYPGTEMCNLRDHRPDRNGLRGLLVELGMTTLLARLDLEKEVRGPVGAGRG